MPTPLPFFAPVTTKGEGEEEKKPKAEEKSKKKTTNNNEMADCARRIRELECQMFRSMFGLNYMHMMGK